MASTDTIEAGNAPKAASAQTRPVEAWLFAIAILIALTAIVGAATRLTGSGLSITEWQPILGVIPPLDQTQWADAFEKYKQIPQYTELNRGMSLDAFKFIYWWEWSHRLLARGLGVVFLLPFLAFLALRRIPASLVPRLILMFALGGAQGGIGWFMVKSGLADRVSVSPYRLALHLGCAVLIYALVIWTALELRAKRLGRTVGAKTSDRLRSWLPVTLVAAIYLQVLSGALVAGHKAGLTYNTWPLMDGRFIPKGLGQLTPGWLNIFENITTVQFNHRMLAYLVVILGLWRFAVTLARAAETSARTSAGWLAFTLTAQMSLGIATLLAWVPVSLGLAHQAGALIVLWVAVWHAVETRTAASA